jgi:branched-subunit amino acid ABC-type transport system permease component
MLIAQVCILSLFAAAMLYFIMEYPATPAIISVVIATIGVSFTVSTMVHSTFLWKLEKTKADNNFPPYSNEEIEKKRENLSHSEFSTLV